MNNPRSPREEQPYGPTGNESTDSEPADSEPAGSEPTIDGEPSGNGPTVDGEPSGNEPTTESQPPESQPNPHTGRLNPDRLDPGPLSVVTGAFGYTGRYIARMLLRDGQRVETITGQEPPVTENDPNSNDSNDNHRAQLHSLKSHPYDFHDPAKLSERLRGCHTLYNTYWPRLAQGPLEFTQAVRNSQLLIDAAKQAGVQRFVHLSVLNPQGSSELPHFRSKALVEQHLRESGLSYAIIRPGLVFGPDDLLLNNLAWMIRRLPLMAVPGDGEYRIQPIDARDLAALALRLADQTHDSITDAVGPETHTFNELIDLVAAHVQKKPRLIHLSHPRALWVNSTLGRFMLDMPLGPDEAMTLASDLLVSHAQPVSPVKLSEELASNRFRLGLVQTHQPARHREE